jgi:outer membrane protein
LRRFAPLFLALFLAAPAHAAEPAGPTLTLKAAVALALQHAFSARIAAYRDASAEAKVAEARVGFLPDLSAELTQNYSDRHFNPHYVSAIPPGYPTYQTSTQADFSANYVLISSTRRLDLRSAQLARESQERNTEVAKRQVIRDTARAYLQVVQADQLKRLAEQDVARRTRHRDEAEALVKAGKRADYENIRAEADLSGAEATLVEARNSARLARSTLAQTIGTAIPLDVVAEPPAPPVDPRGEKKGTVSQELIVDSVQRRADVRATQYDAEAAHVNVSRNTRHFYPTLSVFARYSYLPTASNSDLIDSSLTYGGQLQILFSDNLKNFYRERDARAQARLQDVVADQTRVAVSLDVERAMLEVDRATEVSASVAKSRDAAQRNYETASERYRLGVGSQTEQIDAEAALVEAEVNAAKADVGLRTALWNLRYEMGEPLDVL